MAMGRAAGVQGDRGAGRMRRKRALFQELLADPFDQRPAEEKGKDLGASASAIRKWTGEPGWWDEVYQKLHRKVVMMLPRVLGALLEKSVERGDVSAAKLLLQLTGKLSDTEDEKAGAEKYREIVARCLTEEDT